jgi:hypothetical protein
VDAERLGENRLSQLLLEGLAVLHVLLPVPLHPVAEDLVKEDAARPPGEDGRSRVGLDDGGDAKSRQVRDHPFDGFLDRRVVRQPLRGEGGEGLVPGQLMPSSAWSSRGS